MSKYRVLTDGNGSSLICVVGLGKYVPAVDCDTIKQQNAELAAQVNDLKCHIKRVLQASACNTGSEPSFSCFHRALDEAHEAINTTPAQCLFEVKAEAGRDGFIACLDYLGECDIEIGEHFEQDIHAADQYANKIRGGE